LILVDNRSSYLANNRDSQVMILFLLETLSQTAPTPGPWFPQHGIELLALVAGIVMGFIFVVAAWRGSSTKEVSLKNDPRVKGLLYGLAGFLAMLVADWKPLLGQGAVDKNRLVFLYGLPFIAVAVLGVSTIAFIIFLRFFWIKRFQPDEFPSAPFTPTLDYLHYGYRYHRAEYERASEKKQNERLTRFRQQAAQTATYLAALMLAVDSYRREPTEALQKNVIQRVLEYICLIVQARAQQGLPPPEVNANLMRAIALASATPAQKALMKFTWGDLNRYGHLLLLTDYAYDHGQERFALPVEDPARSSDWIEHTLLGAPEAFLRKREIVVRTQKLDFAKKIPETVCHDIEQYFKGKGFKSFACLIVPGSSGLGGIVNVESNGDHIFRDSDEMQNEIAKTLQPFCAVLSLIL
jgi:hypothetical protein